MTKNQLGASVILGACAILGAVAFFGFSPFIKTVVQQFAAASPSGTTLNSSKIAEQILLNPSATNTIYSVLNTDANQRLISEADVHLYGATGTTTQSTIQCSTSTTQYFNAGNTNWILNWNATSTASSTFPGITTVGIGTTTGDGIFMASTSPGQTGVLSSLSTTTNRIWPSNTYLVCQATNLDTNNKVFNPTTNGFIGFKYFGE